MQVRPIYFPEFDSYVPDPVEIDENSPEIASIMADNRNLNLLPEDTLRKDLSDVLNHGFTIDDLPYYWRLRKQDLQSN